MTISAYQVDNVIKAYNKQQKSKLRADSSQDAVKDRHADIVTLSGKTDMGKEVYSKISYSLLDILTRPKNDT
ncbi:MAG: hypothetical protein PHN75_06610 [Syntrophales bacterium]|nr:hypothetical protein [Syntrophales bacterium]